MDKNYNAKQVLKKPQMASEKLKKSACKKKKKTKKPSSKSDQSPDNLEVEGVGKFEHAGLDSDSSTARPTNSASPTISSNAAESRRDSPTATSLCSTVDNDSSSRPRCVKTKSARKFSPDPTVQPALIKHTQSTSVLSLRTEKDPGINKKITVSFSSFDEIQSISTSLSNMSVKSKNGSSRIKTKSSSKSSSNGANSKKERPTRMEPIKSISTSKAAEEAARIRSEESLRWELALQDEDQEKERIKLYKINRRKRYLDAAQKKGLGWVVNYGNNGSPIIEDSIPEKREPSREPLHATISDFSPVRSIIASQSNTPLHMGGEMAC